MQRILPRVRPLAIAIILVLALATLMPLGAAAYDWPTFSGVSRYVGNNDQETILTPANVGGLHRLFQAPLPAIADGVPVMLGGVATPAGTKDLLFVTTRAGQIVALDAHDGTQIWQHAYGPGDCRINGGATACYTTSS
nr:hypothetical protein [Chloroflexota bacterium]